MNKLFLLGTIVCALGMMVSCGIPFDGEIVIHPSSEEQFDTLMSADTTDHISTAFISLKGYTRDTLYLSLSEGCFWKVKLVGDIDTTYRNDWYDWTLPVSYHTRTTTDGDSVVIKYRIN